MIRIYYILSNDAIQFTRRDENGAANYSCLLCTQSSSLAHARDD
jgi:hypothetical protein